MYGYNLRNEEKSGHNVGGGEKTGAMRIKGSKSMAITRPHLIS